MRRSTLGALMMLLLIIGFVVGFAVFAYFDKTLDIYFISMIAVFAIAVYIKFSINLMRG